MKYSDIPPVGDLAKPLPCPLCWSTATIDSHVMNAPDSGWDILCSNDECMLSVTPSYCHGRNETDLIRMWNTRHRVALVAASEDDFLHEMRGAIYSERAKYGSSHASSFRSGLVDAYRFLFKFVNQAGA